MTVAIIDYGSGNLRSAAKAFERAAHDSGSGAQIAVTGDADAVATADHVVLPGVGAFADCQAGLMAVPGMVDALREAVIVRGRPFFGICVGMQLMADEGHEHVVTKGLGWLPGLVKALQPSDTQLKIPHMGWNTLAPTDAGRGHPVLTGLDAGEHTYFVHSYVMVPANDAHMLATADYGGPLAAIVGRDNMIGTQFHPEKSQGAGLGLIAAFLRWKP